MAFHNSSDARLDVFCGFVLTDERVAGGGLRTFARSCMGARGGTLGGGANDVRDVTRFTSAVRGIAPGQRVLLPMAGVSLVFSDPGSPFLSMSYRDLLSRSVRVCARARSARARARSRGARWP